MIIMSHEYYDFAFQNVFITQQKANIDDARIGIFRLEFDPESQAELGELGSRRYCSGMTQAGLLKRFLGLHFQT